MPKVERCKKARRTKVEREKEACKCKIREIKPEEQVNMSQNEL
jgi:hypothetical protein